MIVSSFMVTLGALVVGAPLALACATYLSEYAGKKTKILLKPSLELLAGIPSVVYGFLGVVYIVPLIREYLGGSGFSILSTSLVLGIMILPTITSIYFDALMSVPAAFREGLAKGGGHAHEGSERDARDRREDHDSENERGGEDRETGKHRYSRMEKRQDVDHAEKPVEAEGMPHEELQLKASGGIFVFFSRIFREGTSRMRGPGEHLRPAHQS